MPARAIGCALMTASAQAAATTNLETVRVFADSRNEETAAVDALENRGDVQRKDADPGENEQQHEYTAEAERREADDARHQDVGDDQDQLRGHQHEAVLGVPLDLGVLFLDEQRNEGQHP